MHRLTLRRRLPGLRAISASGFHGVAMQRGRWRRQVPGTRRRRHRLCGYRCGLIVTRDVGRRRFVQTDAMN